MYIHSMSVLICAIDPNANISNFRRTLPIQWVSGGAWDLRKVTFSSKWGIVEMKLLYLPLLLLLLWIFIVANKKIDICTL